MAEHPAIAAGFTEGCYAIFKGYAQLEEGQDEILKKDDPVKVLRFEGDSDIIVVLVDADGNEVLNEGSVIAERLFPQELEVAVLDDEPEVAAEAPAEVAAEAAAEPVAEKPKRGRAKATAAAPATTEAAAEAPAEAPVAEAKPKATRGKKAAEAAPKAEPEVAAKGKVKAAPKADAKPAAKPIASAPIIELKDMASVTEILTGQDALAAAKTLVERREQTDFTLGGVLRHVHETGVFKTLGYEGKHGFDDYVRNTLGMEPRKASYLMATYTAFALAGVDEAKLQLIGWSKAKEIARLSTEDIKTNFDKLIKFAEDNTREDLISHIKKNFKVVQRGGSENVQLTTYTFKVAEEEAENINAGLKEAAAQIGDTDASKCFAHIVSDWRGTAPASDMTLEQSIEMMEARFGVVISYEQAPEVEAAEGEAAEATA